MDEKQLKKLIDEVKAVGDSGGDMATSKELKNLEDAIKAETDELKAESAYNRKQNDKNEKLNLAQIALEEIKRRAGKKRQDEEFKVNQKQNQGGKLARELILEQNKLALQSLERIEGILTKGGGGGTGRGGGSGGVQDQVDKDISEAAKNAKDASIKEKADKTTIGQGSGKAGTGRKLDTEEKRRGYGMSDADYAAQYDRDQAALKRESRVRDVGALSNDVKTTGKSLNKRKISGAELDAQGDLFDRTQNLVFREDEQLRIGGKNIVRAGDYTTGTAKFKDADTGKFTATDPIKALAEDVRISQGLVGTTRSGSQFRASEGAAELSKNIGANAAEVQAALDKNEAAQGSLSELTAAFSAMQTGKGSKKEVMEKIEKLKVTGGEELAGKLGLDSVADKSQGGFFKNLATGIKTDFFGVNAGTKLLSKKGIGEAFGADRFFGKAGTGKLANVEGLQGRLQFQENVQQGFEIESQKDAMERMQGDEGLGIAQAPGKLEDRLQKKFRESYDMPEKGAGDAPLEAAGTGAAPAQSKREKLVAGRSGTSKDADKPATEETLQKILEQLQETAAGGGGGGGGGGFFGNMFGNKNKGNKKGKGGRFARGAKGLLKGAARFGGPAAAIAGVGMGIYTAVSGSREAEAMADAGQLTAEEEQVAKGEAIGEGAGGAGGALAGAAAGAAIGSVVPFVGTAIGGIIGGAIGYFGGSWLGKKAGGAIADAIDVDPGELAESQAQAEEALKQIEEKDSGIASKIKQEAAEIEASLLEQAGENVSDNDKEAIKNAAIVTALKNNDATISAMGIDRKKIAETLQAKTDAGMDSAKASGLYDEDFFGNSEIDKSKLGDASIDELQAIVQDDDLSDEDMKLVKDTLAQKKIQKQEQISGIEAEKTELAAITSETSPTGAAIENMTRLGNEADTMDATAPVVVNNTTPPVPAPASDNKMAVAIGSPGVRNNFSTIERYYDRRMV